MTKTRAEKSASTHPLIQALQALEAKGDRATLAKLRRALGKEVGEPGAIERDGWVLKHLPFDVSSRELNSCCLIASLFALHPQPGGIGTLGNAFCHLWKNEDEAEAVERRFIALVDSNPADLAMRVRQAVSLLKTNEIPINWGQLLRDLRNWRRVDRRIQRRWAEHFWRHRSGMSSKE